MVVVFASSFMISASATPRVSQTASCPTYQTNLLVIRVDSTPHVPTPTSLGVTVVTIFHVVYPDGTPVTLQPQTGSFLWSGTVGQREFDNVPVVYTGTPGFYSYTATFTQDILQAAGPGVITISVMTCSLQDGSGNRGPTSGVNSLITSDTSDNSQVQVTPVSTSTTMTTSPVGLTATEDVILLIAALLVIALLLLLARSRRKKT